MPRAGAYIVSDLPEGLTAIHCDKCGRRGCYKRATLVERFRLDAQPLTVLNKLADCPRRGNASNPCGVVYSER